MSVLRGAGFVVAVVIALAIGNGIVNSAAHQAANASLPEQLAHASAEANKTLPERVDEETRLESMEAVGETLRYNFTLVNYAAGDLDEQVLRRNIEKEVIGSVCTSREVKPLFEAGATLKYVINGKNGKTITQFKIPPSRCKNV